MFIMKGEMFVDFWGKINSKSVETLKVRMNLIISIANSL